MKLIMKVKVYVHFREHFNRKTIVPEEKHSSIKKGVMIEIRIKISLKTSSFDEKKTKLLSECNTSLD